MKINWILVRLVFTSLLASNIMFGAQLAQSAQSVQPVSAGQIATATDPAQKKQIETVVHDFIIQNPEVVVESLQGYQQKQMEQTRKSFEKIQQTAPQFANPLFYQSTDPMAGNPKGKVTIVEFFDYQCPHCIDMTPVLDKLIASNSEVRLVFKDYPIRGDMSEMAARAALAAQRQGKYFEFHKALMASKKEPLTETIIYAIAKTVNLDVDKLKMDMKDKPVAQQIKANYQLAKNLQLLFTPAFFITSSKSKAVMFIPGQITEAQLAEVIKKISA
jgi:protein-disulfide isomerase